MPSDERHAFARARAGFNFPALGTVDDTPAPTECWQIEIKRLHKTGSP
jgi:hypothetical protein